MKNDAKIRDAETKDSAFIYQLSPSLAEVAKLGWHTDEAVQKMQDDYISEMLAKSSIPNKTMIAEHKGTQLGFVHVRTHKDGITGETCATVPLLAVSPTSQGVGVGGLLMESAEKWAKNMNCRFLHLEVFANNTKATRFYEKLGFESGIIHMIKNI